MRMKSVRAESGKENKMTLIDLVRLFDSRRIPIVTTVFAKCREHEQRLQDCISKTRESCRPERHFLLIDKMSDYFAYWAVSKGYDLILLRGRKANLRRGARMRRLYSAVLPLIEHDFFYTVEHDVIFSGISSGKLWKTMKEMPEDVASVGAYTVRENGRPCYPTHHMWFNDPWKEVPGNANLRDVWNPSLAATLWRKEAFMKIDMEKQQDWPSFDSTMARYLTDECGYRHIGRLDVTAVHLKMSSKRRVLKTVAV